MNDDQYWRNFRQYARRRVGAQATLILWPFMTVSSVLWIFLMPFAYAAGDVRGDIAWRLVVGAGFVAFYTAIAVYAARWLLADRRGDKRPPR